jgi:hypothetical protein
MTYTYKVLRLIILTVIVQCFSFGLPADANATPPSNVQLAYNMSDQILAVTITHASFMTGIHYIKIVQIKKNGQLIGANTYKNQPDKKDFTYYYKIPASPGDVFEITASCSIYGSKTVKLSVK